MALILTFDLFIRFFACQRKKTLIKQALKKNLKELYVHIMVRLHI